MFQNLTLFNVTHEELYDNIQLKGIEGIPLWLGDAKSIRRDWTNQWKKAILSDRSVFYNTPYGLVIPSTDTFDFHMVEGIKLATYEENIRVLSSMKYLRYIPKSIDKFKEETV